jgi:hypothetical protein
MSTDHTHRSAFDELAELRARVERLEQAQQPARSPLVPHFRGVALVPPIECPDPQSWIAERIYEMGKADAEQQAQQQQPAPSTPAGQGELVRSVAKAMDATPWEPGGYTPEARAAILAVADWLSSQHYFYTAADALRRELGR